MGRGLCWWTVSPWGYSAIAKYMYIGTCLKIRIWIEQSSKFYRFISKLRIISLMHSSILRGIRLNFMAFWFFRLFYSFHIFFLDFQLFRTEHHCRDLISRNAHLVHQYWYRISFTNYHWPICWMITFIPFVRLSFSYWLWQRVIL
jgi:hypothetical protein